MILSPTRELAQQTEKTIQALGEFIKIRAHCCIGGTSVGAYSLLAHALDQPLVQKLHDTMLLANVSWMVRLLCLWSGHSHAQSVDASTPLDAELCCLQAWT